MVDEVEREEERAGKGWAEEHDIDVWCAAVQDENGKIEMQYGHEIQCQDWTPIGAEPTGDR